MIIKYLVVLLPIVVAVVVVFPSSVMGQLGGAKSMNLSDPSVQKTVDRLSTFALTKLAVNRNKANTGKHFFVCCCKSKKLVVYLFIFLF